MVPLIIIMVAQYETVHDFVHNDYVPGKMYSQRILWPVQIV